MTENEFEEFSRIWSHLGEIFGKQAPSKVTGKLIFNSLASFTIEQIKEAAGLYVRTQKFMPRPADIAELIFGTSEERARCAFLIALKTTETVKGYQSIAFKDKTTQEVVFALGGWGEFCYELKKNRSLTENRFLKWYQAALSITRRLAPTVLVGIDGNAKQFTEVGGDKNVVVCMLQ